MSDDDFSEAVSWGDLAAIKRMLPRAKVNARRRGYTPLHEAMLNTKIHPKKDPLAIVKLLLSRKAKVDAALDNGQTPLIDAASEGLPDVVALLCEHGADADARLDTGSNALHCIAREMKNRPRNVRVTVTRRGKKVTFKSRAAVRKALGGHPDDEYDRYLAIARILIANGLDVTAKRTKTQQTSLFDAADNGLTELVEILLGTGKLDVEARDTFGMVPLQYASRSGHVDVVRPLLAAGADPNTTDDYGFTPLHQAVDGGSMAVAKLLLAAGGDPDRPLKRSYGEYKKGETARQAAKRKKRKLPAR